MKQLIAATGLMVLTTMAIAPLSASAQTVTTVRYRCDGGETFRAEYYDDFAIIAMADQDEEAIYTLPQVESGSGIRYSDGTITLFSQGDEAFVERDGEVVFDDCVARLVGSAEFVEMESLTVIEQRTVPSFERPVLDYDRPTGVTATPEPEPVTPTPAPVVVPGLW